MKSVEIKQTNCSPVILIFGERKHLVKQDVIAVVVIDEHIFAVASHRAQLFRPRLVGVNEVIFVKRGNGLQCDARASIDQLACSLRQVLTSSCVGVDIKPFEARNRLASGLIEDLCIGRRVLLDNRELDLRPACRFRHTQRTRCHSSR